MKISPRDSLVDQAVERDVPRPGRRMLACLATGAVVGLGAVGPALASDVPPAPPVPVAPVPAPPTIPVPALPPALEEAAAVVTEIDPETIDVSIRVLSPGEDTAAAAQDAVIPPIRAGDTTAEDEVDTTAPDEVVPGTQGPAVNTNVSVRVLSPGSNGGAGTDHGGGGGTVGTAGAAPASPEPDAAPAGTATSEDTADSSQYHDLNSQYQSESDIDEEAWNWVWTLTVDCAGNPTSSSVDSGDPGSLDWSWSWAWEWGCADGDAPRPEDASTNETTQQPAPKAEPRPPPTSPVQSSSDAAAGESEPWSWTWTFTFCGKETTMTTLGGTGTPLTWTWDWSWVWSCGGAAPAGDVGAGLPTVPPPSTAPTTVPTVPLPPPSSVETGPSPSQDAASGPDSRSLQAVVPSVVTFSLDLGAGTATVEFPAAPLLPSESTIDQAIPPAIPPFSLAPTVPLQVRPFPLGAAPLELGPHAQPSRPEPGRPTEPTTSHMTSRPTFPVYVPRAASAGGLRAGRPQPEKQSRAQVTRARPDSRPALPLPRSRHGATSTSASGLASSALLVGIVALAGFVLLAAPTPGRRLEVARELSPRGLDRSPLDHPG